jgi:hypothetical protein
MAVCSTRKLVLAAAIVVMLFGALTVMPAENAVIMELQRLVQSVQDVAGGSGGSGAESKGTSVSLLVDTPASDVCHPPLYAAAEAQLAQRYRNLSAAAAPATADCIAYTGGQRALELYLGHWDAATIVAFPVAPGAAATATSNDVATVQRIALCAAPLVLNQFGVPDDGTPGGTRSATGKSRWFSWAAGHSDADRYDGGGLGDEKAPHWFRLYSPRRERKTRVFSSSEVPSVANVTWSSNQHDSLVVRPADVVVYVADRPDPKQFMEQLQQHLPVQSEETLHAIILYGYVCNRSARACVPVCLCATFKIWRPLQPNFRPCLLAPRRCCVPLDVTTVVITHTISPLFDRAPRCGVASRHGGHVTIL